jgi:two-component system sensor histidine kinase YesM
MIESLSKYFRLSLSKGKDIVTLDEELQLIRSYMHIQNVRFSDGIHTEFNISAETLTCRLPKLTLQPLIENAVLHGILQKKPKVGTIKISSRLEGDCLSILVEDDGVGMPPDRLNQLLQPHLPENTPNSFGLYNVHERVRLYSQTAGYGLTVASELGQGTKVTVLVRSI